MIIKGFDTEIFVNYNIIYQDLEEISNQLIFK